MKPVTYLPIFFAALLLLTSCQRDPSPFEISNLNGNKISAFGHAGIKKSPDYMQSDQIIHLLQLFDSYKKQGWKNLEW